MALPNDLTTVVHVCEDTDKTFQILDLLAQAGYVTSASVVIDRVQVQNPDGSYSPAPTSLVQIAPGGTGLLVTASKEPNWNGGFDTFNVLSENGTGCFSIQVSVVVDPVNDAPEGADSTIALADAAGYVLKESDFGFTDPLEGDALKSVLISNLPTSGQLLLAGVVLAAGAEVSAADVRAGLLVYVPPAGGSGQVSFGFQVRDTGGTEGCNAADLDGTPNFIHFQLTPMASIGNQVWIDTDRDGVQDAGEGGVAGVTVALLGAGADNTFGTADDLTRSTTTDSTGNYLFDGLEAGRYQVIFGSLPGYQFTSPFVGGADTDSDANANGLSPFITLAAGESNMTVDAGLVTQVVVDPNTASLGDRVWYDSDRDGMQDSTETGVAGVAVALIGAGADGVFGTADDVNRSTTTSASGDYLFSTLAAGQYQVTFGGKTGYGFTTANVGSDTTDSDAVVGTGKSQVVTLAVGEANLSVDAGLVDANTAQLGDRVWYDTDRDGVQDSTEVGASGVTVTLAGAGTDGVFGTADDISRSTTTSSTGYYVFNGLSAGQYQVTFGGKTGYQFTTADVGSDGADSDANTATGKSQVVALAAGESNMSVDAGLVQLDPLTAQLGNYVWLDSNRNGVQDGTEAGVAGVTVTLWGAGADGYFGTADDVNATTTTSGLGQYAFTGLAAGQYYVGFGLNTGYAFTTANVGNDATDSDVRGGAGWADLTTLAAGESNQTIDAGLVQIETNTASLGDRLWDDTNVNGIQDAGEVGIAGVTVQLLQGSSVIATTTTSSTGAYGFTGLAAGQYYVQFGSKTNYIFTYANMGADEATDSDVDTTGRTDVITLATGQAITNVDAGMAFCDPNTASLGDRVWIDADRDGVQDSNEVGAAGVTVTLAGAGVDGVFGTGDDTSRSTVTTSTGYYMFSGLAAGQYQATFGGKTGYGFTTANVGSDAADSDAVVSTGKSQVVTLGVGEANVTVDAGLVDLNTAALGDRVWLDANRNGLQDSGEVGKSGVTVTLWATGADGSFGTADDVRTSTTTDANGNYLFSGLAAGRYSIIVSAATGYEFTTMGANTGSGTDSDVNASGNSWIYSLAAGQTNLTADAGLVVKDTKSASLGDTVWFDTNRNGVQDSGEVGASGVVVTLAGAGTDGVFGTADDTSASQTSSSTGTYRFYGLAAGQYQVTFGGKTGYQFTTANVGSDATDSDASVSTGKSQVVTLGIGEHNLTVDAGLVQIETNTASLGDRLWDDTNVNGIQDAGEVGIAGVTVQLLQGSSVIATTTTSSTGAYGFTGLAAGQYYVQFGSKTNYIFTYANMGADEATDSDVDTTGRTDVITLATGQAITNVDAGMAFCDPNTASLGDRVWIDADRDGVQDSNEVGAAGVTVTLAGAGVDGVFGTGDDTSRSFVTTSTGYYMFTGLAAGQYQATFGGKTGYGFTTANVGSDAADSDALVSTGKSQVVTLAIGESNQTVDAGLVVTDTNNACLGNRVWYDTDRDGVQDSTETGVSGVTVQLAGAGSDGVFGTADDISRTATTDTTGYYQFSGLAAGQYQVTFGGKTGYQFTTANVGSDATDSDATAATGKSHVVTLAIGESNQTVDAGLVQSVCASIQGAGTLNEGAYAAYTVNLTSALSYSTTYFVSTVDGSAKRTSSSLANKQAIQAGGAFDRWEPIWNGYEYVDTYMVYQRKHLLSNSTYTPIDDVGPTDMSWDYSLSTSPTSGTQTGGFYVTVNAGQTSSSAFYVNAWKEAVYYDNDYLGASNLPLYKEAAQETFSLRLASNASNGSSVVVCNPDKTVAISDTTTYATFSPIALDLDGNGIQTTSLGESGGKFDLLGTGVAVHSGWISGGDAFLAVDANGNQVIDDIGELFGGHKGDGFAKLATFDSNGDGLVNASDADFAKLLVWQDANGNHATDAGELRTLAQAGITSLNTAYVDQAIDQLGNILGEASAATRADGSSVEMVDVYFNLAPEDVVQAGGAPLLGDLLESTNALFDTAFGAGEPREQAAIADVFFDAGSEAQRVIAEAMRQADATLAVIA